MSEHTWLIRARFDRLGIADLTDAVLTSGMSVDSAIGLAPFACSALDDARKGIVPEQTMRLIAGMPDVPDAVYARLYDLITLAITDRLARVPKHGRVH